MTRQAITIAALVALYASPARANDLEDTILSETLNCVHTVVFSAMPAGRMSNR